jgi:hypothetical protein
MAVRDEATITILSRSWRWRWRWRWNGSDDRGSFCYIYFWLACRIVLRDPALRRSLSRCEIDLLGHLTRKTREGNVLPAGPKLSVWSLAVCQDGSTFLSPRRAMRRLLWLFCHDDPETRSSARGRLGRLRSKRKGEYPTSTHRAPSVHRGQLSSTCKPT